MAEGIQTADSLTATVSSGDSGRYMESAILFTNTGKVWDTRPVTTSDSIAAREYFRTINVQWIGQWGLFSRCGTSQNQ